MKLTSPISVKQLAQLINASAIIGDDTLVATGINEIHKVQAGDITFSDVPKYFDKSLQSAATIILLNKEVPCPEGKAILVCADPFAAYNGLVWRHRPFVPLSTNISETASIHPSAIIEPNVIIGHHVIIGENCHIQANTTICEHSIIGNNVTVQPNCIIGSDAFYYKRAPEGFLKWRSGGRVIIEDDVEIGAGCTINKGVSGDTIIGAGTKFDCQVHIGHGAVIGKSCLFAAQVGVGGKTTIEDRVVLYGQVGVAQGITIGAGAVVLAKSGVSKSLAGGKSYFGAPAKEVREAYKELATLRQLAANK
jgi:UDP-3-O-[3-hydroxymyristoyl] glucosamine N-acyltransferase